MNIVLNFYEKYNIEEKIKIDLRNIEEELEVDFKNLGDMHINIQSLKDFRKFYVEIMDIAKKRLSSISQDPID